LVAAAKVLVAATKKIFVVSNFVAVTKPFFSVQWQQPAAERNEAAVPQQHPSGAVVKHSTRHLT